MRVVQCQIPMSNPKVHDTSSHLQLKRAAFDGITVSVVTDIKLLMITIHALCNIQDTTIDHTKLVRT